MWPLLAGHLHYNFRADTIFFPICLKNLRFLYFSEEELATPPLDGIILPGVTRQSILELTKEWVRKTNTLWEVTFIRVWELSNNNSNDMGHLPLFFSQDEFKVTERYLTMSQLCCALKQQRVKELFGSGTACMICPIEDIVYQGEVRQRSIQTYRVCKTLIKTNINQNQLHWIIYWFIWK